MPLPQRPPPDYGYFYLIAGAAILALIGYFKYSYTLIGYNIYTGADFFLMFIVASLLSCLLWATITGRHL